MNPVSITDLEVRWRTLTTTERSTAQALLDDAWAVLTLRLPTLEQRHAANQIPAAVVVSVVTAMVLRVLRNPDGKVQESIDDYSYRRADGLAEGALYVSASELALLRGSVGASRRSVPLSAHGDWQRAYP